MQFSSSQSFTSASDQAAQPSAFASLTIIILAAGKGSRMHSDKPKVLHELAGQPFLTHVLNTARQLQPQQLVVVHGHGSEQLQATYAEAHDIIWAHQAEQLGTGHAVKIGLQAAHQQTTDQVLVLYGDVPLIQPQTLQKLLAELQQHECAVLTAYLDNASGYGRILRDQDQQLTGIVEQKDANAEQLTINEINSGIIATRYIDLQQHVAALNNNNAQQEYYLTDVIGLIQQANGSIGSTQPTHEAEILGINSRVQQAQLERLYQTTTAQHLLSQGVTLFDPARIDIRGHLQGGKDVTIDINCVFVGDNILGSGSQIGANCHLTNVTIDENVIILPNSVLEDCHVKAAATIGPFARIRPGTILGKNTKVGNFVEVKKVKLGDDSKINHLSYVGDAVIGKQVNIGAGTITCNYDGANKHVTEIGDHAFIGSDTQLVAPVTIGAGATIGAGSTIRKDAPAEQLTLTSKQTKSYAHWQRPAKKQ